MAQNTMNNKSEDVVKNVESNNVESTSNKQRQTVKPKVISRRRLLRAGMAGIPVVLTMTGVAPAAGIQTVASAASGLMYGGNKVRGRFEHTDGAVSDDNLVWSNHNGFVLKNGTEVYTSDPNLNFGAVSGSKNQGAVTFTNDSLTTDSTTSRNDVTFTVNNSANLNFDCPAYLHKSGAWYTDLLNGSNVFLSNIIKNIDWKNNLTVTSSGSGSAVTIKNVVPVADSGTSQAVSFDNGSDWVETAGYQDDSTSLKNFYLCPDSSSGSFKVNFKFDVTLECTEDRTVGTDTGSYPFTATTTVELPLTITVSNIPGRINYDGTI